MKQAKPVSAATRALLDQMSEDAKPTGDKLDRVRKALADLRDDEIESAQLAARLNEVKERINTTKNKTLVDVFDEAGITSLALEAEGNLPRYEVEIGDYFHANIPAEKSEEAYAFLRSKKSEDLIKSSYTIEFGLREAKAAERFQRSLDKAGIGYSLKQGVPWNTLTSWFKVEHKKKPLSAKAMGLLGATVGRVAKVVKQKEKK
jgi:hypothetical protein